MLIYYNLVPKRRNTAFDNPVPMALITDKFWQEQVKRLIQETKNYKQLQKIKEQDTRKIVKEFMILKDKFNTLQYKYSDLSKIDIKVNFYKFSKKEFSFEIISRKWLLWYHD